MSSPRKIHPKLVSRFVPAVKTMTAPPDVKRADDSSKATASTAVSVSTASSLSIRSQQKQALQATPPGSTPDLTLESSDCSCSVDPPRRLDVPQLPVVVQVKTTSETTAKELESPENEVEKQQARAVQETSKEGLGKEERLNQGALSKEKTLEEQPLKTTKQQKETRREQTPPIGTRVSVYWDGEDAYYEGEITRERGVKSYIEYDDGDREWIDLTNGTVVYRVLAEKKRQVLENLNDERPRNSKRRRHDESREEPGKKRTKMSKDCAKGRKGETDTVKKTTTAKSSSRTTTETASAKPPPVEEDWVAAGMIQRDSSDSETDEEEIVQWASRMFGIAPRPIARPKKKSPYDYQWMGSPVHIPISEKVKLGRRRGCTMDASITKPQKSRTKSPKKKKSKSDELEIDSESEDQRRKRESARPLTAEEIRSILAEDNDTNDCSSNWVRRSVRQPSKSVLSSPMVKALLDKLRSNDTDMVVLKMKKYVNDPNTPCIVIDAVLDALEENTNCESLYIQNFNEGMRDDQVKRLLQVLQRPSCKIWCLNIGETYKVKTETWELFTEGLKKTKITHIYASEHTITAEMKDQIRRTIRENRNKHNMHIDPNNLDTIIQCTHCWWNPVNAKALRPFLKKRGYEFMLQDKELQGLKGSMSGATLT